MLFVQLIEKDGQGVRCDLRLFHKPQNREILTKNFEGCQLILSINCPRPPQRAKQNQICTFCLILKKDLNLNHNIIKNIWL